MHRLPRLLNRLILSICALTAFAFTTPPDSLLSRDLDEVTFTAKSRPSDTRALHVVQTLTAERLATLASPQLSDALKRFAGVTVKDYGGIGGLKTVSVRSLGAQHTGVIYDGIALSDCQSGQIDLSRFSLDNVATLSLAVGQDDDLFRSAKSYASSAVLTITTDSVLRHSGPASRLRLAATAGSYGLASGALTLNQRISERLGATAHVDYLRADGSYPYTLSTGINSLTGRRTNSDVASLRAELSLAAEPRRGDAWALKGYYYNSERGLPGAVVIDNPYSAERLTDRIWFVQSSYTARLGSKVSIRSALKWNEAYTRDLNDLASGKTDYRYTQREAFASATALVSLSEHFAFSLGEDFARNTLSANTFEHKYPRRNAAYSLAALRYSTPRFALTASALHTYVADRVRTGDAPPARSRLSPAAALAVRPFEESTLRLRASVKEVYRIPTFNDMYYLVIGNSDLRPERARQAGLGLTWSGAFAWLDYVSLAADGYYNRIADKIVAIPTMFIWKMSNADKAEGWGTDLTVALEKRLAPGWSLAANGAFSWMRAVDISSPSASNYRHQLPYTPRRSGTASADLTTPWLTVGYSVSAASSRYRAALNEPANLIAPYADHSLSLTRTFRLRRGELTLQGSVSNLTNTNYEIIKYYPMAPRNYRAGLKYSF